MGGTPKWMIYKENPIEMDDLGVPPFMETPISRIYAKPELPRSLDTFSGDIASTMSSNSFGV